MVKLTFFGGVDEIGGNKILVEDKGTRVFFDFGLSFAKGQKFYTGYLNARNMAGAADDLELGLIPKIKGLYGKEQLKFAGLKHEPPKFDAIFISHGHMDHCAHLQHIDEGIDVFVGETTKKIIESFEPSKEEEALGVHPYKTFRTGKIIEIGDLKVEPIHVDHSVPGAYGFLIHTGAGTIAYTGDFRFHGPAGKMTKDFVKKAAASEPIALITEGTRLGRKEVGENLSEKGVGEVANQIVSKEKKLVITTFYGRDIDRINTFYQVAKENGRKFLVSMRTAHLLNKMKDDPRLKVPDPLKDDNIIIYARRKKSGLYDEKDYYNWEKTYLANHVGCEHVRECCDKCVLNLDLYNFTEIVDIKPEGGSFIHSMSEPFTEGGMDQIEQDVMLNWLDHFGLSFHQVHASGHVSPAELKEVIEEIDPKRLIPVHTEKAGMFNKLVGKVRIVRAEVGKGIEI